MLTDDELRKRLRDLEAFNVERTVECDPNCLTLLKDFRSLMPLAQEARKPMFLLKPADGAFGGHQQAVVACYRAFEALTKSILGRCGEP